MSKAPGSQSVSIRPSGVTDAIDGSNAPSGSMLQLKDLIPNPTTRYTFVPRPAALQTTNFSGFSTPAQGEALLVVGTRAYGFIASARFAGKSEPFCYDLVNGDFIALANVLAANCPTTQPTTGDWVPPTVAAVTNSRIIFTHPGYNFAGGYAIGWIDISDFSINTLLGNVVNGSKVIQSINDGSTSAPTLDGVEVGQTIAGTGIPVGATVAGVTDGTFSLDTTCTTNGTSGITVIADLTDVEVGMQVAGIGFAPGTYVTDLPGGGDATLSQAALNSAALTPITFSGGGTITLSVNATASNNSVALAIAGGTPAAPLYGAGQTAPYPLVALPKAVGQFNGRAYYAVLNTAAWSDSEIPTQVSNADQAITLGDNTPVTGFGGSPLTNQLTGGIIQALFAFKGGGPYWQITGDAATNDLVSSETAGSMGPIATNTIVSTPIGLAFVAQDGLRVVQPSGLTTEPLGANGQGVCYPFINAINPTRMCAAYNHSVIRVSVQNGNLNGQPFQEWWYDINLKVWTGPHSFPAAMISAYDGDTDDTFIMFAAGVDAALWQSAVHPSLSDIYVENGVDMTTSFQTSLSPDNSQVAMNTIIWSLLGFALPGSLQLTIIAADEQGNALDTIVISGGNPTGSLWDGFDWGAADWGAAEAAFEQIFLPWHYPLTFKQMTLLVACASMKGYVIGNLNFDYKAEGYPII